MLSGVVCSLPWNLKIIIAFISDVQPIFGYRRLSYLLLGLLGQAGGWIALGLLGTTATLPMIAAQQFAVTFGQVTTGVMCDALVVEGVASETGASIGKLQTSCQIFFALGGLLGTALAGVLPQYGHLSNEVMFLSRGFAALAIGVMATTLVREGALRASSTNTEADIDAESKHSYSSAIRSTSRGVWNTMCLMRVFRPLIFIFVFAAAPNSSDAFNTYLLQQSPLCRYDNTSRVCLNAQNATDGTGSPITSYCVQLPPSSCDHQWGGLEFDATTYAAIGLLGSFGSVLGNYLFRRFLLAAPWHGLFATTVCLAAGASALQMLLMFRSNKHGGATPNEMAHIPDVAFALGDDIIVAVANQLLAMPILILMARLCPQGAEGTTYALVTSVQMSGGTVGGILSQLATASFGVTNTNFSRLWQLTLLTSTAKLSALLFLPLVPSDPTAAAEQDDTRRSMLAGASILALFAGGLIWAFVQISLALV